MKKPAINKFSRFQFFKPCYQSRTIVFHLAHKIQIFLITAILLAVTSVVFSEPNISILWEKDIAQNDRWIKPYTIKVDENKNIVRIVGVSYIYKVKETPRRQVPELFEYRVNLKDNTSESNTLMAMDACDITINFPHGNTLDSRLIGNNIVLIRSPYKSCNFQELTISSDWQVKTKEIPGLTRLSVSTLGACVNINGDVFLCGNSGYIRKVTSDGNVAWDINYKSDKPENNVSNVAFSESENILVAFGCSWESDTKFTTKDSSLWLANLDSEGNFKTKTEFEGISNFGKFPAFCLNKSDNPVVIYDNDANIGNCKVYVSKFSKDLNIKVWTTRIFDGKDMMVFPMFLTPLEDDYTLATLCIIPTKGNGSDNLHLYLLDNNGSIVNKAIFTDIEGIGAGSLVTGFKDRIFLVTNALEHKKNKVTEITKLICFKITR